MVDENPYYSGEDNYSIEDNFEELPPTPMNKKLNSRFIIELLLGLVFILLLFLISLMFILAVNSGSHLSNNQNSNEIIFYPALPPVQKSFSQDSTTTFRSVTHPYSNKLKYFGGGNSEGDVLPVKYISRGEKILTKNVFGEEYNKYLVYVKNQGPESEYFTVIFYFYDRGGHKSAETLVKYIFPDQEETFVYRDIFWGDEEFVNWTYDIILEDYS